MAKNACKKNIFMLKYASQQKLAEVAEWQTHGTQNPARATSCGFDSHLRHQNFMKEEFLKSFKDVEKGILWDNYKKYSAISIYDTLDENLFDFLIKNLDKLKTQAVEITFDINNQHLLAKARDLNFLPIYHWYIYNISDCDKNLIPDKNIKIITKRKLVRKELINQVHELAKREPSMFDKNGEEKNWYKAGKNCIAYNQNGKILSILTWQYEPQNNNIHIYLTYTLPEYRSKGYNSKLFDYIKKYAFENNIQTLTVCTDVTPNNRVPNMFYKNNFKYFKTGFKKLLKTK